jgi:phage tail sheath protein FI
MIGVSRGRGKAMDDMSATPGVYVVEKDGFPSSVAEMATAVPAFIGYTEKASSDEGSLHLEPRRIASMAQFEEYFGGGPDLTAAFTLTEAADPEADAVVTQEVDGREKRYVLTRTGQPFYLHSCMRSFFDNGGGPCYVVSAGVFVKPDGSQDEITAERMTAAIDSLAREQEPTLMVVPDAVLLGVDDCVAVQRAAMEQASTLRSRFTVLDVRDGWKPRSLDEEDVVTHFRKKLGVEHLGFAAAYYPWIETTVVQSSELGYECFDTEGMDAIKTILETELVTGDEIPRGSRAEVGAEIDRIGTGLEEPDRARLNKTLIALSPIFNDLMTRVRSELNRLPPGATMAGVYASVDNSRGVWKAPANVGLNGVVRPCVDIAHHEQEDLTVTPDGKSVNAIRAFAGEGTLVWGARTLDGNSVEWRYVPVRRTMIMLEQSITLATKAYVFEPNDAGTWDTIKSMIRTFLADVWKRGGLAGASPDEAFSVHVGLQETMTPEDIREGILRVTVLAAPVRPAEFIELTIEQQMQRS